MKILVVFVAICGTYVDAKTLTYGKEFSVDLRKQGRMYLPFMRNTVCPDGSSCPGSDTCCMTGSATYECCPYSGASCCSDHKHCCPSGYTCSGSSCSKTVDNATKADDLSSTYPCPDGNLCEYGDACCRNSIYSKEYYCCKPPTPRCCSYEATYKLYCC